MRYLLPLALIAGFVVGQSDSVAAPQSKSVEIAICLDTSNSMDGLIESAKLKLWTIVNDLAKIDPTPSLRVAIYQYGNDNLNSQAGWVRQEIGLTDDLDDVYKKLNALKTRGGTELVARVCRDALNDLKWSNRTDGLKLIFVCGNEPADQDKEVALKDVATLAIKKGIVINTIYCGMATNPEAALWREFATIAGGKYLNIDQSRAQLQARIKTPHDEALLKLNDKLNGTYLNYSGRSGAEKQMNQAKQDGNALAAAPGAAIDRLATKNSKLYNCSAWDIIDKMKNDPQFDLKSIKEENLCEELRKIKPDDRIAYLKKKAAEREELQKEIEQLTAKRSAYIQEQIQKKPQDEKTKALDEAIRGIIREQAQAKGLNIPK